MKIEKRPLAFCDIEVYPNLFLIGFMNERGEPKQYSIYGNEHKAFTKAEIKEIRYIMSTKTLITFNGVKYDLPLILKAMQGATIGTLYEMSVDVVTNNLQTYQSYAKYDVDHRYEVDHVDISEVAQGVFVSLKAYASRLHAPKIQDLPYPFDTKLGDYESREVGKYNINDLEVTQLLYNEVKGRVDLRYDMTEQYDVDVRSKSDAQIAETVIVAELGKVGVTASKPKPYLTVRYKSPDCVDFMSDHYNGLVKQIEQTTFKIHPTNGQVILPDWLKKTKVIIGDTQYQLGVGGLHSKEKSLVVEPDLKKEVMRNADVASYYPSMIMEFGFYPKHLTEKFLSIYGSIKARRLKAKANGDKIVNESLKIVLNGSFGKLGSKYSKLYAPDLMLQVTMTGQLMLLMLIERLEWNGFRVVSSNTDGVEYVCPIDRQLEAEQLIFDWELDTGMDMEHGTYKALYARDVNNYVAVYDGYTKAKGVYAEPTLSKNSEYPIVFEAIRDYLLTGKLLEHSIRECKDITRFLTSRTVRGGAVWKEQYLGKVVRWYYCPDGTSIHYQTNNNKVPKSDGACPLMDLTDNSNPNIDYDKYIELAVKHLSDLGVDYVTT